MRKRLLALLAVLAVLTTLSAAPALGEAGFTDISARTLVINRNSDTLGCMFADSKLYCLINPDGTRITEDLYNSITALSEGPFFKVETESEDGIHDEGIIDDQGKVIVPAQYADVHAVSDRWAYGVKLTPSTADDKDYTFTFLGSGEKQYFRVDTVDFYYRGDLAGTLKRSDFEGYPTAFGDYICVSTQERNRKYYNSLMELAPEQKDAYGEYSTAYKDGRTIYTHNGTGQTAFAPGCTLSPDEVVKAIAFEKGKFLNLQGDEAFTTERTYENMRDAHGDYAIVTLDGKSGLIDNAGREIIPPEYDELGNYEDRYLEYGVISAVKDGKFGYLDAEGNVTCSFTYAKDIVRNYGPVATVQNLDGTYIVLSGTAGELPEHYAEVNMSNNARAFLAKTADGNEILIDMNGKTLIGDAGDNYISFNRAATVAFHRADYNLYRIYTFDPADSAPAAANAGAAPTASAADSAWTCANGHKGNTGSYCSVCGRPNPALTEGTACPVCGTVYPADYAPDYCPADGTQLK